MSRKLFVVLSTLHVNKIHPEREENRFKKFSEKDDRSSNLSDISTFHNQNCSGLFSTITIFFPCGAFTDFSDGFHRLFSYITRPKWVAGQKDKSVTEDKEWE